MKDLLSERLDCGLAVDLTPMIDVLFMLLIFFLTTSAFIKPAMEVMLPEAESSKQIQDKGNWITITIDHHGSIFMDGKIVDQETIRSALQQGCGEKKINLFMDKRAPFSSFIGVIDITKGLGIKDVVVTTETRMD